ncbi:ComEC/Rec2 family competence protein [Roseitranquillus sediminis]|uniref:ComEC/Rec2 family competence protein n=1 Tax=Roseitranquillus sediminis TaxID=2809051 RepID=UPI001D0C8133|nr:ComEC/Rec2 family competence protein [Roseitranquillus sediminis]
MFPWVPVCLGVGIGIYFALRSEPDTLHWSALAVVALALLGAMRLLPSLRPVLLGIALVIAGFGLAGWRTHDVAAPVLSFRYYGPVEGRIVAIDRSMSEKVRLTLDRVVLERTPPARTPERVRVSLHGEQGIVDPVPGQRVMMTANLSPPNGPVEPGGFDFQRQAWFQRLGAVGYTRTPMLLVEPAAQGRVGLWMTAIRAHVSQAVQTALPGRVGAFAAAIMTGDRSGMDRETLASLRASNLAHLLAISGLHMGLLSGFVFAALRYGLAAVPGVGLRLNTKKIAAVAALGAAAFYLGLSGGNVATERAFIMVAVMLVAVLLDRRALSLRAVALAAIIVLFLRPEALVGPGFQMSFAATVALVGAYGWLRDLNLPKMPVLLAPLGGALVSSGIAGAATAPFGAVHFNQVSHYGLLANSLSVPLMGSIVIPGAVLSAILAPFGFGWVGLALMAPAIAWILGVSDWVAGLSGSLSYVPAPGTAVLPLIAFGGLWVILWQGRLRLAGVVPMVLAMALWVQTERPAVLVSPTGGLVGVMTDAGRVVSKPKGEGFAASSWLENDGDGAGQAEASTRPLFRPAAEGAAAFEVSGVRLLHLTGRGSAARAERLCEPGVVVILSGDAGFDGPCRVLDRPTLEEEGGVAMRATRHGLMISGVLETRGARPWTGSPRVASGRSGQDVAEGRLARLLSIFRSRQGA